MTIYTQIASMPTIFCALSEVCPVRGYHAIGEMVITLHIEPSAEQQMRALGSQYRVRVVMS
jgi:hypothetical protein